MNKNLQTEFKVQLIMLVAFLCLGLSLKAQYNYLGTYNSQGKPNYLEPIGDTLSTKFLADIDISLPESKPVPIYNPHYISNNNETDIQLIDSAALWVTFVAEGAGYRNTLGFYTYDLNSPPQTISDIQNETIIFPNVSKRYSGGDLLAGDKVKLGDFKAGTGIGWFLIANGWNGSAVGSGNWKVYSNPDFNPEPNPTDRFHNVLLNDSVNERIVLGFEDIRRDYASCDQDFNDAIFYITANPYTAIKTDSINAITNSTGGVGSGGNGGLESNGNLASKIAVRNYLRQKNNLVDYDNLQSLPEVSLEKIKLGEVKSNSGNKSNDNDLPNLLPTTSLFNSQAYLTTPQDLTGITNAEEVYALDYLSNDSRLGAAMIMFTENAVYDHTKAVCDRLNGASLIKINKVRVVQNEFLIFKLEQANGSIEYALNFLVHETSNGDFIVDNKWSINDYLPTTKNYNVQIWSSTHAMTIQLLLDILSNFEKRGSISFRNNVNSLPQVYIKSGYYKSGALHLEIINNSLINEVEIQGSLSKTETSEREQFNKRIQLKGSREEKLILEVGKIFDVGFKVNPINEPNSISDHLYTADGTWTMDYDKQLEVLSQYSISEESSNEFNSLNIERNLSAKGELLNYISFIRQLQPSARPLNIRNYSSFHFKGQSNQSIEVTFMDPNVKSWEDQIKTTVKLSPENGDYTIYLDELINQNSKPLNKDSITAIVFSISGNGVSRETFELNLSDLHFGNEAAPSVEINDLIGFPNPVSDICNLLFYGTKESKGLLKITNISGQVFIEKTIRVKQARNELKLSLGHLPKGLYIISIASNELVKSLKIVKKD